MTKNEHLLNLVLELKTQTQLLNSIERALLVLSRPSLQQKNSCKQNMEGGPDLYDVTRATHHLCGVKMSHLCTKTEYQYKKEG